MSMWLLAAVIVLAVILFTRKIYRTCTYWKNKDVAQVSPFTMFIDMVKVNLRLRSLAEVVLKEYNAFPEKRYVGTQQIGLPILMIRDPELIKQITVKEFEHFTDHRPFGSEDYESLWANNLFSLKGEKWKNMRATLNPTFTSSKMKAMFALICETGEQFTNHFLGSGKEVTVELKDAFSRFSNDVIANCAFGVKCDSLKDRENEFFVAGQEAFSGFWLTAKFIILITAPKLAKFLGLRMFSAKLSSFFTSLVANAINVREKNNIVRPDLIHLLMEAKKGRLKYEEDSTNTDSGFEKVEESQIDRSLKTARSEITDMDIVSQALVFYFGGFESVSTFLCFMGYELAVNSDIQQRLRIEIDSSIEENGGELTYEALNNMKYLDMVASESLRKYPAGVAIDRCCTRRYTIEPKHPDEKPVVLEVGDVVWLPVFPFHRDPQYYPEPERFDPERFSDENGGKINPYTYIPFGVGPRNCIASRFGLVEAKTVICYILRKFELAVVEETQIPLKLSSKGFNLTAEKGFWVGLRPRNKGVANL